MKKSRFSVEQIVAALKQAELGMSVADLVRQLGISEQTFYRWKKQYAGLQSDQVREFKQLQDENAQLRQAVTDAQAAAQANADALAQFQADDAATDAQQLADAAQAVADDLQSTLDGLKNPPAPPEPLPEAPGVIGWLADRALVQAAGKLQSLDQRARLGGERDDVCAARPEEAPPGPGRFSRRVVHLRG